MGIYNRIRSSTNNQSFPCPGCGELVLEARYQKMSKITRMGNHRTVHFNPGGGPHVCSASKVKVYSPEELAEFQAERERQG